MNRSRKSPPRQWPLFLVFIVFVATAALAAPVMIDDFLNPVGGMAAADSNPPVDEVATAVLPDPGLFGNWRVMQANLYPYVGGAGTVTCSANAGASASFLFHQTPAARGTGFVWWDGDSSDMYGDSGFSPIDLTDGGTNTRLALKRFKFTKHPRLYIDVQTTSGFRSYMEDLNGPPNFVVSYEIPFEDFDGPGSFTEVIALRIGFNGTLAINAGMKVQFESVQAVP